MGNHILWVALGWVVAPREGGEGGGAARGYRGRLGDRLGLPGRKVSINCKGEGKVQLKAALIPARWWGLPAVPRPYNKSSYVLRALGQALTKVLNAEPSASL